MTEEQLNRRETDGSMELRARVLHVETEVGELKSSAARTEEGIKSIKDTLHTLGQQQRTYQNRPSNLVSWVTAGISFLSITGVLMWAFYQPIVNDINDLEKFKENSLVASEKRAYDRGISDNKINEGRAQLLRVSQRLGELEVRVLSMKGSN